MFPEDSNLLAAPVSHVLTGQQTSMDKRSALYIINNLLCKTKKNMKGCFKLMNTQITLSSICSPSEDVVVREIEGDMIIVPLVSGIGDADDELYTLNESGKAIWQKLDGQKTLSVVTKELKDVFSSDASEIEKDVLGFASEMVDRGMLIVNE
jgi:hypothetical protein